MKHISVYLLFALAIPSFCFVDVAKLSTDNRKILQDASRFEEVHSTRNLPPGIAALCTGENGKMADPGQKWNATDLIIDPTPPGKRLIWAGVEERLLRRAL